MTLNPNSAQFAPVAPIHLLRSLYDYGPRMFGSYHLLLAHHTLEKADEFADFFAQIEKDKHFGDGELTIIMDNSIVELGDSVDAATIAAAVDIIADNCPSARVYPVLPDVMGNGSATRTVISETYEEWSHMVGGNGFMAVCQGKDLDDFRSTLNMVCLPYYPEIVWIGVPRILNKQHGSRLQATKEALATGKMIHLLGFSDDMEDDFVCAKLEGVMGIDSAVPLRIKDVFNPYITVPPREASWFEEAEYTPQVIANLQEARRWVGEL